MPALLTRIFRRSETGPSAGLVAFGPHYTLAGDRLAIESGPLAGTALRIERGVSKTKADFNFYETADSNSPVANRQSPVAPDPMAHCHFDRDLVMDHAHMTPIELGVGDIGTRPTRRKRLHETVHEDLHDGFAYFAAHAITSIAFSVGKIM